MRIQFYGHEALPQGRSLFLAGPTTDAMADGRRDLGDGLIMSAWRARFVSLLIEELFLTPQAVADLTIIVPEFHEKDEGPDWFASRAAAVFGSGRGVLKWEEAHMTHADLVVAWGDVRRKQPGLGLNARPEIYGLMLRMFLREGCGTWAPKRLLLGVPSSAQAAGRYHLLAEQLKLEVLDDLPALAKATAAIVSEGTVDIEAEHA